VITGLIDSLHINQLNALPKSAFESSQLGIAAIKATEKRLAVAIQEKIDALPAHCITVEDDSFHDGDWETAVSKPTLFKKEIL
jgi:hypothetical protein